VALVFLAFCSGVLSERFGLLELSMVPSL
jgi:hypothetical protein